MVNRVLYRESQEVFKRDVENTCVSQKMEILAKQSGLTVGERELASWSNNAPAISTILEHSKIRDSYITFEFLVPFSRKRIDCVIYGKGETGLDNVIHIELKQWSNKTVSVAESEGNFTAPDDELFTVTAFVAKADRTVAHPSQQVKGYQGYLTNFVEVFSKDEVSLTGLAYCYNYTKNDNSKPTALFDQKYESLLRDYPTYGKDQNDELIAKLESLLIGGNGLSVFNKVMDSPIRPSKKLLNEVTEMIENGDTSAFSLMEDQIVARNMILDKIRPALQTSSTAGIQKSVILVKGGPGTGKTVIALHILAELSKLNKSGHGFNVHYATKSKPLLEGVRAQLRPATRNLFSNVISFIPATTDENSIDVLLVDEAHRIEKRSTGRFTPAANRTDLPQIDTIIRAAKITVFFIDDMQAIRGVEIGSSEMIKDAAARWGADVKECELTSQFRCNGSDNYLNWLEEVLYNKPVSSRFSKLDYDLRVFDSPKEMYEKLVEQNNQPGQTARLMAGFCWPWSTEVINGDLVKDVQIGDFAMPWETSDNVNYRQLTIKYPKWFEWAYKPDGIKQVGCIYTAQGFEFDYAGVIIGRDLRYDTASQKLITDRTESRDPVLRRTVREATMTFDDYVRNIYRVLMSRGMKGCYLYICDDALRNHFKSLLSELESKE